MVDTAIMRKKSNIVGWILAIPSIISILMFIIYPLVYSFYISLTDWRMLPINVKFIGFENYVWLFDFENELALQFWHGIKLSLYFTFFSTLIQTFLGFILAYAMYNMGKKTQSFFKVMIYIPVILPMPMISVMFQFFLSTEGVVNKFLSLMFNMSSFPEWLSTDGLTMWVVIAINTWRYLGFTTVIYFVAMLNVDKTLIESARIDGAGKSKILTAFILPLTWSSTQINLLLSIIGGLKSYDFFLILTNGFGDTQVVGLYIYKTAYEFRTFCRGVTMSIVMSVFIGFLTFFTNKFLQKGDVL